MFPGYAKTLATYAAQPVDWAQCYDDGSNPLYECADIEVPMDWHHPERGSIGIDITRARATGPHRRRQHPGSRPGGVLRRPLDARPDR